ncbi:hypothetical protein PQX77_012250 [Marasmius sp. AFHP31]|nr:hypothetical protein PQX77_012250 [Marasmius sp. AFHP31]
MLSTTFLPILSLLSLLPATALVSAHGQAKGFSIAGTWYDAPNIYFDGDAKNQNTPIRKGYQASSPAYLLPQDFNNNNKMACEEAAAAPGVAKAKPGDEVRWEWEGATPELSNAGFKAGSWVHAMGPTLTYIASCNGDCKNTNAADLDWVKIQYSGLNGGSITDQLRNAMSSKSEPYKTDGVWAMAQLVEDGSTYTHNIPQGLKNGQYMLRSEIIAVHNPLRDGDNTSGPQSYVSCAQIEVVNGGDVSLPAGTKAGSLYATDGDLAKYSVFTSPTSFNEPGPQLWTGGSSGGSTSNNNNNGAAAGTQNNDNSSQNQNQGSTDNSNQGQENNNNDQGNNNGSTDNQNQGDNNGSTDNQNQGENNNNDQNNDNNNSGESNQNQGSTDNSNEGQGNTDASNNGSNDNSNQGQGESQNQNSGNSTSGSSGKTCRRSRKAKRTANTGATISKRQEVPAQAAAQVQKAAVHAHQQRSLFGRRVIH